ncbi:MAG: transglutaminase-like cysteine peptidase [Pseudomonadota bacterium]
MIQAFMQPNLKANGPARASLGSRLGLLAGLAVLASACMPIEQGPLATGPTFSGPGVAAAPYTPFEESTLPLEVLASLQTGGISQGSTGRAGVQLREALSQTPGPEGIMVDGPSIGASPRPWLDFCRSDPSRTQCAHEPATVEMTGARLHQLMAAQAMVHQSTEQRPDAVELGDRWELIEHGQAGDCEDMALTKRDILMTWGWPAGALRPAICVINQDSAGSQLHAVLTVDTTAGTYVLGNLVDGVTTMDNSECAQWVMRSNGVHWSWIEGGATIPLGPVSAKR